MLSVTYVPFKKDQYGTVEKVLAGLSKRDKSFKYWIKENRHPRADGFEYVAAVRSYSLDQAHKRGLLITRRYLSQITPQLRYEAVEATHVSRQVDLLTRSLKALSDVRALALLVALKSAKPLSVKEFSKALGINSIRLRLALRKLREGELVTEISGKLVLTERGVALLARMSSQGSKAE